MRNKFAECLTRAAETIESLCLLYADIGNRLFDKLKGVAPTRTINAGIAEANMASMASPINSSIVPACLVMTSDMFCSDLMMINFNM